MRYLRPFMASLLGQQLPEGVAMEVLIADGMSDDGTRELLEQYSAADPRVTVFDNPRGIVSPGLNEAIRRARGEVIIRMDVHSEYAPDYVRQCLAVLDETGADNVGGPARSMADGYMQEAIALAYHSGFACGGARFHDPSYEGYVDTVTFGCWRRPTLDAVGPFDEALVRNQDDEHNLRLVRRGGRIWQSPRIRCWFKPRSSVRALFRQYGEYGYWKVYVIRKHRLPASVRHLVPAAFVGLLLALCALACFSRMAASGALLGAGAYAAASLLATALSCNSRERLKYAPVMPVVFAVYHFSYGWGFLLGMLRLLSSPDWRSPADTAPSRELVQRAE
jgi:glycosyltransferase involved in cell wall biosynthesis